ncbi:putative ankyrin repeat protein [Paratrimastix pyriformis]|uniref:Ankyrin repeat protein n=1 Tax=Paratrimastix pyriformis TaxID=342808 RepID=A0ABQ8USL9_9EUKA|nr:putative ankyrin repeat protein [Paratrimastix pyriformis]
MAHPQPHLVELCEQRRWPEALAQILQETTNEQEINLVNDPDVRCTPLHFAAQAGERIVIEALLAKKSAIAKDKYGLTPLHRAARNGHAEACRLLLAAGATLDVTNVDGETPLFAAVSSDSREVVQLFLESGAQIGPVNVDGETPLHHACFWGRDENALLLVVRGASVDAPDGHGQTPIMQAVRQGHNAAVETMIRCGARLDALDGNGETPLHHACRAGQAEVARTLLANGANPNARSRTGKKPTDLITQPIMVSRFRTVFTRTTLEPLPLYDLEATAALTKAVTAVPPHPPEPQSIESLRVRTASFQSIAALLEATAPAAFGFTFPLGLPSPGHRPLNWRGTGPRRASRGDSTTSSASRSPAPPRRETRPPPRSRGPRNSRSSYRGPPPPRAAPGPEPRYGTVVVPDTNVLIDRAGYPSLEVLRDSFDSVVMVPWTAVSELDMLKNSTRHEVARAARHVTHLLFEEIERGRQVGTTRPQGWWLQLQQTHQRRPLKHGDTSRRRADERILEAALYFREVSRATVLLTSDVGLRLLASSSGVDTQDIKEWVRSSREHDL